MSHHVTIMNNKILDFIYKYFRGPDKLQIKLPDLRAHLPVCFYHCFVSEQCPFVGGWVITLFLLGKNAWSVYDFKCRSSHRLKPDSKLITYVWQRSPAIQWRCTEIWILVIPPHLPRRQYNLKPQPASGFCSFLGVSGSHEIRTLFIPYKYR